MNNELTKAIEAARIRDRATLWGVSPESLCTYLLDVADSTEDNLGLYKKTAIIRTNYEPDTDCLRPILRSISAELGLISEDEITDLGLMVLTSDSYERLIQVLTFNRFQKVNQVTSEFKRIGKQRIPREELESFFTDEEVLPQFLIDSFHYAKVQPDSVEVNEIILGILFDEREEIDLGSSWQPMVWAIEGTTGIQDRDLLLEILSSWKEDFDEDIITDADKVRYIRDKNYESRPVHLGEIEEVIEGLRSSYVSEKEVIENLVGFLDLTMDNSNEETVDRDTLNGQEKELLELVASVKNKTKFSFVVPDFLTSRFGEDPYQILQRLNGMDVSGLQVEVIEGNRIHVQDAPCLTPCTDIVDDYFTFLIETLNQVTSKIEELSRWENKLPQISTKFRIDCIETVEKSRISPFYFTYTLLNPLKMGEEIMNQYVGDERGLEREKAGLKRWSQERSISSKPYKEMLDRLFNLGIRKELEEKALRIMMPYDDDTFQEYASTLRDLAREGYEIRFLTRHTRDKYLWDRLKDNLLGPMGEERERVFVRTYSRYKNYRIVSDEDDPADEFGIHGKMQAIGGTSKGAVLLGSANFMENSLNWNPECGVYTKNPHFLESSISFFDFVWRLAEADTVSFDQMKKVPDREFHPSYYQR